MNADLVDLYLRLSVDRDGKDALERQEADLRAWADREGLTVRKVWSDNASGFKDVKREDFDKAIRAVTTGEVGTLAVWKLDRLSRRGAGQVGTIMDQIEAVKGRIVFYRDSLDTSDSNHRTLIILVSEQARAESANTSVRVRAKIAADASKGIPKKGTRPFGWESDGITLRESEAIHIREAVRYLLEEGGSMIRIAHRWNEANVKTDGMSRERRGRDGVKKAARPYWTATTVRNVLLRGRNAGLLVHDGEELENSLIQPIITRAELDALRARVKVGTPMESRASSALGGIIRCACGAPMHMTTSYSQRKGGPRYTYKHYVCSQKLYDKTQKHASIAQPIADKAVGLQVIAAISLGLVTVNDSPAFGERLGEIADRLTQLNEQEANVEDMLAEGLGNKARHKSRLAAIAAERDELNNERQRIEADRVGGNVFRVIEQMNEVLHALAFDPDQSPLTDMEEWAVWEVLKAWNAVPGEDQQALIRGRFNVSVKLGGRGEDRVSVEVKEALQ